MPGPLPLGGAGLSEVHRKDRTVVALVQAASEEGVRVTTASRNQGSLRAQSYDLRELRPGRGHPAHPARASTARTARPLTPQTQKGPDSTESGPF